MIRPLLLASFLLTTTIASAQDRTYDSVDEMPAMVGGLAALQQQLQYPKAALDAGVEGRVMIQFVVDEEGGVVDPSILRGAHPALDQAALDALGEVAFTPGQHEGQPARVRMILPVTFVLPDGVRSEKDVAEHVEQMPVLEGGMASLIDHLEYPKEAEEEGLEGRVIISFIVDVDGSVEDAEVASGIHPFLDAAALRAVRRASFTPGRDNGVPVRVRMALPVTFRLASSR